MLIEQTAPASGSAETLRAGTHNPVLSHLRHLLKGSALYIAGDLLTKLLAFVLIPLYTRYLTPSDYGILEVVKALANGLTILCVLGLNGALTRFYFDHANSEDRARFLGTTIMALIGNAFVVVCVLNLAGEALFERFLSGIPFDPYVRLATWTVFLTSFSTIALALYRVREEPGKYVGFQLAQSILGFGLIIYFVAIRQNGAVGKLQGELLAAIALVGLAAYLIPAHARFSWSWMEARRSLKFGAPLVPHLIFWWVIDLSDRMFLQHYATLQEVGIYSLGYNIIASLMVVAIAGLNNAWAPYFFSRSNRPGAKDIIAKLLMYFLCGLMFIGLMLSLFARELVVLITTPEYYDGYRAMPIIVIAFIFAGVGTILSNLIFYGKTSHHLPLLTGLAACVNIGLNVLLIPRFGMMGAAYATLLAMAVYAGLVFVVSQKVYRIEYEQGKIIPMAAAFMACLALGLGIRPDHALASMALKAGLTLAFVAFLWRYGIVRIADVPVLSRSGAGRV